MKEAMNKRIHLISAALMIFACTAFAESGAENICIDYFGVGQIEGEDCKPLPGKKLKIGATDLQAALDNSVRALQVVSDNNPDEAFPLDALAGNSSVHTLDLFRVGQIDLTPIEKMKGLRSLSLSGDAASALGQLTAPPASIARLSISAPQRDIDLSALSNMPNLRVLYVKADSISGQENLRQLTKLERANFDLSQETDFSVLSSLTQLKWLSINGSLGETVVSDISFLSPLVDLIQLDLSNNDITDLNALRNLKNLRSLILSYNKDLSDITPIADLTNLRNLQLRLTQVSDLSMLTGLQELCILWLDRTPVADIGPLARLSKLWGLELSRTNVTDISALKDLPLEHLDLSDLEVSDYSPIPPGTKLKK